MDCRRSRHDLARPGRGLVTGRRPKVTERRGVSGATPRGSPVRSRRRSSAAGGRVWSTSWRARNRIQVRPASRVVVTSRRQPGVHERGAGDRGSRWTSFIFPVPYYFNHEMAVVMANARVVAVPTARDHQLDVEAIAGAITPAHARGGHGIAEQSDGAVYPEGRLRGVNTALPRPRPLSHSRRGVRVLHVREHAPLFARVDRRRAGGTRFRSFRCRRPSAWRAGASDIK
jgi:hypothetical protein